MTGRPIKALGVTGGLVPHSWEGSQIFERLVCFRQTVIPEVSVAL